VVLDLLLEISDFHLVDERALHELGQGLLGLLLRRDHPLHLVDFSLHRPFDLMEVRYLAVEIEDFSILFLKLFLHGFRLCISMLLGLGGYNMASRYLFFEIFPGQL